MLGVTALSRISGAIGPVAHSRQDMDLFYRVLFATPSWKHDIKLVPLGWREVDLKGKGAGFEGWSGAGNRLRVGIMRDDGVVRPVKPIRRAIDAMVKQLEGRDDVEVVDFSAEHFEEAWKLTVSLLSRVTLTRRTSYTTLMVVPNFEMLSAMNLCDL